MENLNAEQVKSDLEKFTKSFECCHQGYVEACGLICKVRREMVFDLANNRHPECNEDCKDYEPFPDLQAMRNALALINSQEQRIKELTEENERLHATRTELTRVQEEDERLKNRITCQVVLPDEKLEEIKNECLERIELDIKAIQADTVRKMQSEIEERCIKGGIYPAFVASTIDQIAKEMLEGVGDAGE